MIGALKEWITSIVMVTMFVSLLQTLIPESTIRKIASFIGGLVLIAAILQPLRGLRITSVHESWESYQIAIEKQRETLERNAQTQITERVEQTLAVCIQEKAKELGISVIAAVKTGITSDGVPVPEEVRLMGDFDERLSSWMELELGIGKEQQIWKTSS